MAYACPKCGGAVTRNDSSAAGSVGGLVGALLAIAFAGFHCAKCGPIARADFPDEVRGQLLRNSLLLVVGALVVLVAAIAVVVALNH